MIIEAAFQLSDPVRSDGGNGRRYDVNNIADVVEASQESVELRQMLGFYGHPNTLLVKEGLQNQPSNVCTSLKLVGDMVHHTQQILETQTGAVVRGMAKAKAGGWSWRAAGSDGGRAETTTVTTLGGFDYVHVPSFSSKSFNVTESLGGVAESPKDHEEFKRIRESLINEGVDKDWAEEFLFSMNDGVSLELKRLNDERKTLREEIQMLKESLVFSSDKQTKLHDEFIAKQGARLKERMSMVEEVFRSSSFRVPPEVRAIIAEGAATPQDVDRLIRSLTKYGSTDLSQVPLRENQPITETVRPRYDDDELEYDFNAIFRT